jgi:Ca-activated chloride channel family protein
MIFGDENFHPDRDLLVRFETVRDDVEMNLMTYIPAKEDSFGADSFYALWVTPPDSVAANETIPRDIVFTADVSSSMEGERLQQLKLALHTFLDKLTEADRFNIVTFGTNTVSFRTDLVSASPNERDAAALFVNGLSALGLTNIDEALSKSLRMSYGDQTAKMLIFLTDGEPTWGETNIQIIADSAKARNKKNVRIFPFAIGADISKPLLINLARQNGGYPTYITRDDSIALVIGNHFARISKPVLSNLQLNFGGLQTYDRYPYELFDLFWGSQVMQFGRYLNGGTHQVTLQGSLAGQLFELQKALAFNQQIGGNRAVARLWANSKINYLLEQIELYGELDELVDAVIDLSIRFGILTPYTALYSDPTTGVEEDAPALLPKTYVLQQNFPNPFNPRTQIAFYVPGSIVTERVVIKIYDILGRLVRVLFDRDLGPGRYEVAWDGRDDFQRELPSGTYIYKLQAGPIEISKKMTLLR